MNPRLQALFADYAESHQHPTNRLTHKIAIPLIVFHVVAMLDWVTLFTVSGLRVSFAMVALVGAIGWYLSLDVKLAVIMGALMALCIPLARVTPPAVVVGLAVGAWLVQLAGHAIWEKKSPAFLRNMLQALVGPLFFVAILTGDWPRARAEASTS